VRAWPVSAVIWFAAALGATGCQSSGDQTAMMIEVVPGAVDTQLLDEVLFRVMGRGIEAGERTARAPLRGPDARSFPLSLAIRGTDHGAGPLSVEVEARGEGVLRATASGGGPLPFEDGAVVRHRLVLRALDDEVPAGRDAGALVSDAGPSGHPGDDAAIGRDAGDTAALPPADSPHPPSLMPDAAPVVPPAPGGAGGAAGVGGSAGSGGSAGVGGGSGSGGQGGAGAGGGGGGRSGSGGRAGTGGAAGTGGSSGAGGTSGTGGGAGEGGSGGMSGGAGTPGTGGGGTPGTGGGACDRCDKMCVTSAGPDCRPAPDGTACRGNSGMVCHGCQCAKPAGGGNPPGDGGGNGNKCDGCDKMCVVGSGASCTPAPDGTRCHGNSGMTCQRCQCGK
jgi:hypothetical protein